MPRAWNCARHERGVLDADAEPEAPHRSEVVDVVVELVEDEPGPRVIPGVDVAERGDVVAVAAPPRHVAQVDAVVDAVVGERGEPVLLDGVPEPEFGRDAVAEPVQDRQAVGSLRRGGEPEQLRGLQVARAAAVGAAAAWWNSSTMTTSKWSAGRSVEVRRGQALDRREDVVERLGPRATDPLLAERVVAQRVPEGRAALVEDLLAVRDEQQPCEAKRGAQPGVVDRGHHGLAGTGGGDEQVAVVTRAARETAISSSSRSWKGSSRISTGLRTRSLARRPSCAIVPARANCSGVVRDEVAALPVALEDRRESSR